MAMKRKRKIKTYTEAIPPTPERLSHGGFEAAFVHHAETGTKSRAMVLTPWHVMMFNRGRLTKTQVGAIAQYVHQWDIRERSPIKSNLDKSIGSGNGPNVQYFDAGKMLDFWNSKIGKDGAILMKLVACQGLGYVGAARSLHGDYFTDHDSKQTGEKFISVVNKLAKHMA
jgi:hypothetical protein